MGPEGDKFLPHPLGPPLLTRCHRRGGIIGRGVDTLLKHPVGDKRDS